MYNPMCCISPRWGCLVMGVIGTFWVIMGLLDCAGIENGYSRCPSFGGGWLNVIIEVILLVLIIIVAVFLLLGSIKEDGDKIKIAFFIWIVLVIIWMIIILWNHGLAALVNLLIVGLGFIYCTWIVFAYYLETGGSAPVFSGLDYCPIEKVV